MIGWLYPELMSTYGDRGNIIVLLKRCEWRNIDVRIERISLDTKPEKLNSCDLIFMGGAQDTQQEIVNEDLFQKKGAILKDAVEAGIPGLYICGAYQFLGEYYKTAEGKELPGLGIFPCFTENPGEHVKRLIGNIVIKHDEIEVVGFENHGGRTYLTNTAHSFGTVIKGFGNNGEDKTEGILYRNSIGSYLHGPILPKNPKIADWLIKKALEKKYEKEFELEKVNDNLENDANETMIKRLS